VCDGGVAAPHFAEVNLTRLRKGVLPRDSELHKSPSSCFISCLHTDHMQLLLVAFYIALLRPLNRVTV
jgi:hypothetical protein